MSLRAQLLAGLAVLVLAAVSSTGWLVLRVARGRLEAAEDARAQLTADEIARLEQSWKNYVDYKTRYLASTLP